jgi:hypothetical protein
MKYYTCTYTYMYDNYGQGGGAQYVLVPLKSDPDCLLYKIFSFRSPRNSHASLDLFILLLSLFRMRVCKIIFFWKTPLATCIANWMQGMFASYIANMSVVKKLIITWSNIIGLEAVNSAPAGGAQLCEKRITPLLFVSHFHIRLVFNFA